MTLFAYDASAPFDLREARTQQEGDVTIHTFSYLTLDGQRTYALLVVPPGAGPFGGVEYLHGAGGSPENWLDDAVANAAHGMVSLLVSQPEAPTFENDANPPVNMIVYEMRELRRALDLLASQPNVDRHRLAFVGFSFGAVRGATFAGIESSRLRAVVLGSFNPSYHSAAMTSFDPIVWLPHIAPAALLLQLGRQDTWFTEADGEAMNAAAREPKQLIWYDAGHGLDGKAVADRMAWLAKYVGDGKA